MQEALELQNHDFKTVMHYSQNCIRWEHQLILTQEEIHKELSLQHGGIKQHLDMAIQTNITIGG